MLLPLKIRHMPFQIAHVKCRSMDFSLPVKASYSPSPRTEIPHGITSQIFTHVPVWNPSSRFQQGSQIKLTVSLSLSWIK